MNSRYLSSIWALARAYAKRTFRDKTAMFFTFLFPLMFLLVFGSLNRGTDGITFNIAIINNSTSEFATQFNEELKKNELLEIDAGITSLDGVRQKMSEGELDSALELPADFGELSATGVPRGTLIVYYDEANPQSGQILGTIMQSTLSEINKNLTQTTPPFAVEQRSTATQSLNSFDYIFSGLLAFSLLSLGIFGVANSFPAEKKTGSLRRLRVAPIGASQLILANVLNYLLIGLISIAIMVVAGILIFDFTMRGNYLDFTVFSIFGIIMMFGFGLAIGGWAKNPNQSAPLTNIVAFPLMFLSGVFFPRFLMPEWLQSITAYLPLSPIVDGMRGITAEGKALLDLGPELAMMAVWTIVIYILAVKIFRWE